MADLKLKTIQKSCLKGIKKSFFEYKKWSNEGLWRAHEYLLTINIAKILWKANGRKYITIEDRIIETLKDAKVKKSKRTDDKVDRLNGFADIIVWSKKNAKPKCIIEVKHRVKGFNDLKDDIDRISDILKQKSTIKFGISTFFIENDLLKSTKSTKNNVEKKIEKIYKKVQEHISESNLQTELHYQEILTEPLDERRENSSFSVVIIIKKKI